MTLNSLLSTLGAMIGKKQRDLLERFFADMSKALYVLAVVNNLLLKEGFSLRVAVVGGVVGTLFLGIALYLSDRGGDI